MAQTNTLAHLAKQQKFKPLFSFPLSRDVTSVFNLSKNNTDAAFLAVKNEAGLSSYLQAVLQKEGKKYGGGGYLENRTVYARFPHFNNVASAERHFHLGVDVWAPAYTAVYCPHPAKVHSFAFNGSKGDYGGTLVLEHSLSGERFYSLYGHLSMASLQNYKVGKNFAAGEKIGELGDVHENVDWPPLLHFQLMLDVGSFRGDYPRVCSAADLDSFKANCPNPNLVLQLPYLD